MFYCVVVRKLVEVQTSKHNKHIVNNYQSMSSLQKQTS